MNQLHDPDLHRILGPAPCDNCPTAAKCAAKLMCCRAFVRFVAGVSWQSSPRLPRRSLYRAVFDAAPEPEPKPTPKKWKKWKRPTLEELLKRLEAGATP